MSTIVVSGDTSGAITIAAPAVAGTNTLTLPASTGTVALTSQLPVASPAFSAYLPTTNQSVTTNTWTKVTLSVETFDTNSCFDSTTNYRFTPTTAGYYQINGHVYCNSSGSSTQVATAIYKNGSSYKVASLSATAGQGGVGVSDIVYLNGSTDYVELYGLNVSTNSPTFQQGSTYTYFSGALIRVA